MRLNEQQAQSRDELLEELLGDSADREDFALPEIEDVLPYAGHHVVSLSDVEGQVRADDAEYDVLKRLSQEYKSFLIWGTQYRSFFVKQNPEHIKLRGDDRFFDDVRERMKEKTLTECILASGPLIEKVCEEFEKQPISDDDLYKVERQDILRIIAPDNFTPQDRQSIPSLLLQEFYKPGIDSLL